MPTEPIPIPGKHADPEPPRRITHLDLDYDLVAPLYKFDQSYPVFTDYLEGKPSKQATPDQAPDYTREEIKAAKAVLVKFYGPNDPQFTRQFNTATTDESDPTPEEVEAAKAVLQCSCNLVNYDSEVSKDIDNATMALLATETLNRTFADLKSKSEDVRLRASYDLYGLVATASRGKLPARFTQC